MYPQIYFQGWDTIYFHCFVDMKCLCGRWVAQVLKRLRVILKSHVWFPTWVQCVMPIWDVPHSDIVGIWLNAALNLNSLTCHVMFICLPYFHHTCFTSFSLQNSCDFIKITVFGGIWVAKSFWGVKEFIFYTKDQGSIHNGGAMCEVNVCVLLPNCTLILLECW